MIIPQKLTAKLTEREDYNERFSQYHFELVNPDSFQSEAGQYVLLQIDSKTTRAYSRCDRPDITNSFEILVDHQPNGVGTTFLRHLNFGDAVEVIAPLGRLIVTQDLETVLIATGSGITPFRSIILDRLQLKNKAQKLTLIWGMRHDQDFFWLDDFLQLQKNYSQFTFVPVVSQPSQAWTLATGRVTDIIDKMENPNNMQFFLCGNPAMVISAKDMLINEKKVAIDRVKFEQFG